MTDTNSPDATSDTTTGTTATGDEQTQQQSHQSATDTGDQLAQQQSETDEGSEQSDVEYWKRRARENEERAKSNHRDLEKLRRESMSEQERAIAEARDAARNETLREVGGRLVDAEVRTAAANRPINVDPLLEGLDRTRFLTDDGEVDRSAVTAWLDELAPVQQQRSTPDMAQGARGANRSNPEDVFGRLVTDAIS